MKYKAINELDCFDYHDAEVKEIELVDNQMIWTVSAINAMITNSQNAREKDMCVEYAIMTFENMSIEKIEFGAYKVYDSNHNLIDSAEATLAKQEDFVDILAVSTSSYCFIYGMDELLKAGGDKYRACFNIDGGAGSYYLTFTFSSSTV